MMLFMYVLDMMLFLVVKPSENGDLIPSPDVREGKKTMLMYRDIISYLPCIHSFIFRLTPNTQAPYHYKLSGGCYPIG